VTAQQAIILFKDSPNDLRLSLLCQHFLASGKALGPTYLSRLQKAEALFHFHPVYNPVNQQVVNLLPAPCSSETPGKPPNITTKELLDLGTQEELLGYWRLGLGFVSDSEDSLLQAPGDLAHTLTREVCEGLRSCRDGTPIPARFPWQGGVKGPAHGDGPFTANHLWALRRTLSTSLGPGTPSTSLGPRTLSTSLGPLIRPRHNFLKNGETAGLGLGRPSLGLGPPPMSRLGLGHRVFSRPPPPPLPPIEPFVFLSDDDDEPNPNLHPNLDSNLYPNPNPNLVYSLLPPDDDSMAISLSDNELPPLKKGDGASILCLEGHGAQPSVYSKIDSLNSPNAVGMDKKSPPTVTPDHASSSFAREDDAIIIISDDDDCISTLNEKNSLLLGNKENRYNTLKRTATNIIQSSRKQQRKKGPAGKKCDSQSIKNFFQVVS